MARDLPPMTPLVSFVAAAETRSFARAAEKLFVTPAAISKAVKTLEANLGVALFVRGPQHVRLTDIGRQYYDQVGGALSVIDHASANVRASRRQSLTICAFPSLVMRWLVPRWSRLQAAHPDIDINFATTLGRYDLLTGPIDGALLTEERDFQGCEAEFLLALQRFPVCAPGLRGATGPLHHPDQLEGLTLLHAQTRRHDWRDWLAAAGVDTVDPESGLVLESSSVAYQAAIEGLGVAIGLSDLVRQDLASGQLHAPFGEALAIPLGMFLVRAPHARENAALSRFAEWLREARG